MLRYAFRQGPGRDFVAPLGPPERPLTTSFGTLPGNVATDRMCPLVWGTVDLCEDTVYPRPAPTSLAGRTAHPARPGHGLRLATPGALQPVQRPPGPGVGAQQVPGPRFVHTDEHAWFLDVYRHGLLPIAGAGPRWPDGPVHVSLAGRFTHLPSLYGRLRGPLVELELGISLRSLLVAFEVLGLCGELPASRVRPRDADGAPGPRTRAPNGRCRSRATLDGDRQPPAGGAASPAAGDIAPRAHQTTTTTPP